MQYLYFCEILGNFTRNIFELKEKYQGELAGYKLASVYRQRYKLRCEDRYLNLSGMNITKDMLTSFFGKFLSSVSHDYVATQWRVIDLRDNPLTAEALRWLVKMVSLDMVGDFDRRNYLYLEEIRGCHT